MSKHGRDIICAGCGGRHPVNRSTLKESHQPGGFKCKRCKSGKGKSKRPREFA